MAVVVVSLAAIVAMWTDAKWMILPNCLTVGLMGTGLVYHGVMAGMNGLWFSLAGLLVGVSLLLIPAAMDQVGFGDVKLLAGFGAWVGWKLLLLAFAVGSCVGLVYVLGVLLVKMVIQRRSYRGMRKEPIPYGISLGMGIIITSLMSVL